MRRYPEPDVVNGYSAEPAANLDGSRILKVLRQNLRLIIAIMVLSLGLAVLFKLVYPPQYTATSTVLVDQRRSQLIKDQNDVLSQLPPDDTTVVDTEVGVLNTSQLALQVARKARLVPPGDPSQWSADQSRDAGQTIRSMLRNLKVQRQGLTWLIDITYRDADPELAQRIANLYAETYIANQVSMRADANRKAMVHLQDEIARLQGEVTAADAAVSAYKSANGLTGRADAKSIMNGVGSNSPGGTLNEQEISAYNQNLALARAQAANDSQLLAQSRAQLGKGVDSMGNIGSPQLSALRSQQALAAAQVAALSAKYGPSHPELVAAQKQLNDADARVAAESHRYIAGLEATAAASGGRAAALSSKLSSTEASLKRADQAAVRLHELESRVVAPQTQLDAYRTRLAEISTASGTETADSRIIAYAAMPIDPVFPTWPSVLALGLFGGVLISGATVLGRSLFSTGVSSPEEVEGLFGVEFLSALPHLRQTEEIGVSEQVVHAPRSVFSEAVRALAAGIFLGSNPTGRIVAITSPHAGEGKTVTTIALGRSMALRGRRVLVMDCDLQRPSLDTRFGIGNGNLGLVEVLGDRQKLSEALVPDGLTPAFFLPMGNIVEPGLTLNLDAFKSLLDLLRGEFDVILLDLPPVLQVAESRLIAQHADGTVLLSRWKKTSRHAVELALSLLSRSDSVVYGIAITDVPEANDIMLTGYGESEYKQHRLSA
jgi:capsular exopolysaccharide synthesis family protein